MPGREDIFHKAMNEGHSAAWDQEWSKAASAYRRAQTAAPVPETARYERVVMADPERMAGSFARYA